MTVGVSRCRGARGAGMVSGLVLLFAFTSGGVIWLSRDVDRTISHRSSAQSVAFQAARAGAQQVDVTALRLGSGGVVPVDPAAARAAAIAAAGTLFDTLGLDGSVTAVDIARDHVTVRVQVSDDGRVVTGVGSARAADGP